MKLVRVMRSQLQTMETKTPGDFFSFSWYLLLVGISRGVQKLVRTPQGHNYQKKKKREQREKDPPFRFAEVFSLV